MSDNLKSEIQTYGKPFDATKMTIAPYPISNAHILRDSSGADAA